MGVGVDHVGLVCDHHSGVSCLLGREREGCAFVGADDDVAAVDDVVHRADRWGSAFWVKTIRPSPTLPSRCSAYAGSSAYVGSGLCGGLRVTSAGAERTAQPLACAEASTGHLRGCGADARMYSPLPCWSGSLPRVRSGRHSQPRPHPRRRVTSAGWSGLRALDPGPHQHWVTSAGAERTGPTASPGPPNPGHLRGCGVDTEDDTVSCASVGSPPRVRSGRDVEHPGDPLRRVTSAGAERTPAAAAGRG